MANKFSHPLYEKWEQMSADEKEAIVKLFFTVEEWTNISPAQRIREVGNYEFRLLVHDISARNSKSLCTTVLAYNLC